MSNEDGIPDFHQIKDNHELAELKGYEIEDISESPGEENKSLIIFLRRSLPDGRIAYRELMITGTINKFITDEY